jgi:hypothetical protein
VHDLLIVLRPFSVFDPGTGRRELRPGTIVNLAPDLADKAVAKGIARRLIEPAPLFVDSERPTKRPKKGNDGTIVERPGQSPGHEAVPRDERPHG